jgi:heme-degrading monooxygenase HmoA
MSTTDSKTIILLFSTTIREGCDKSLLTKYFTDMVDLAKKIDGYLGIEVFGEGDRTIAVAKFSSLEAVDEFKNHPDHIAIMRTAFQFFSEYELIVADQIRATGHKIG